MVRSFTVEKWGRDAPAFQINDTQDISCQDAIKTYGFEDICAGLVEMLKCQEPMDAEFKELQARIEKIDSLIEVLKSELKADYLEKEKDEEVKN